MQLNAHNQFYFVLKPFWNVIITLLTLFKSSVKEKIKMT